VNFRGRAVSGSAKQGLARIKIEIEDAIREAAHGID
jgi:hypothetical protein